MTSFSLHCPRSNSMGPLLSHFLLWPYHFTPNANVYGLSLSIRPFQGQLYTAIGHFYTRAPRRGVRGWSPPALYRRPRPHPLRLFCDYIILFRIGSLRVVGQHFGGLQSGGGGRARRQSMNVGRHVRLLAQRRRQVDRVKSLTLVEVIDRVVGDHQSRQRRDADRNRCVSATMALQHNATSITRNSNK